LALERFRLRVSDWIDHRIVTWERVDEKSIESVSGFLPWLLANDTG
jgi:hypothetical protein